MTILEKSLAECHSKLIQTHLEIASRNLINFLEKDWFALSIIDNVKNLEFGTDDRFGDLLQALTWAYAHPGTVESLIRIAEAIYGQGAVSTIDWETNPGLVNVNVQNANTNQQVGIMGFNGTENIGLNFNGFGLVANKLINVESTDRKFFLQFLPVGKDILINFS